MEDIKAWNIMKEGLRSMLKQELPEMSDEEIHEIINKLETECDEV